MIQSRNLQAFAERFAEACEYAASLHAAQLRKGTRTPYLSHLLAVSSLVLENGGNEDEAIAALLHDAVEDQGGKPTLEEIRQRFGVVVARIVEGCTDSDTMPKPPWKARKLAYVEHLRKAPRSVRLVASADKLHNARCVLADYRTVGEKLWKRFTAPRSEVLWYYREVTEALRRPRGPAQAGEGLVEELDRVVSEIERLTANR